MIIDTSVVIAILKGEPDAAMYTGVIEHDTAPKMSAATFLEVAVVARRSGDGALAAMVDEFVDVARIEIVPFTPEHARLARDAFHAFGRGSGHPAKLNFGDCFSYALARAPGEPLLFKGEDFAATNGIRFAV